jgi:hypothetical protein
MAKPLRKQRRRGDAPAGWQFLNGKPEWIPSPTLRKLGWKRRPLKDLRGQWLGEGASIDLARRIVAAVAAWRAGEPVPFDLLHFAPDGADTAGGRPDIKADRFSIGPLIDAYFASPEFSRLAASTRADYRWKMKRLVDTLAGYAIQPSKDAKAPELARYAAAVAEARADPVFVLEPTETARGLQDPLHTAYQLLLEHTGQHMAFGVLAVARLWLVWCHTRQSRRIQNWAADVRRVTPAGRIRPLTWEELTALVAAADSVGLQSIGDSIILGVDLSWSQADRLKLTWDRVVGDRAMTGAAGRQKTGRVGGTPFLAIGLRRLEAIRKRQAAMAAHPTHVLWCERTKAPWGASHYRHAFAEIRALAATKVPSVIDARDQDLRDTAVTVAKNAGLSNEQIASRTLQKLQSIVALLDAHYGEIGAEIADQGKVKLDAYLEGKGVTL